MNGADKMTPRVSVIIPVYNAAPYLEECLDSVLGQDVGLEVICVDDCSTDDSALICEKYARRDSRVRLVRNTYNVFAGVCRNIGMYQARGEYIHFLDADDKVEPGAYREFLELADAERLDVLRGTARAFDDVTGDFVRGTYYEQLNITGPVSRHPVSFAEDFADVVRLSPVPWMGIFRRTILEKSRIHFNALRCSNDVSFFFDLVMASDRIRFVRKNIVQHRVNNAQSLMGIRAEHFECVIESMHIICHNIRNQPRNIRRAIVDRVMQSMPKWLEDAMSVEDGEQKAENLMIGLVKSMDLSLWNGGVTKCHWYRRIVAVIGTDPLDRTDEPVESHAENVAMAVTWPARKVRDGVRCLRENGVKYTVKHIVGKVARALGFRMARRTPKNVKQGPCASARGLR